MGGASEERREGDRCHRFGHPKRPRIRNRFFSLHTFPTGYTQSVHRISTIDSDQSMSNCRAIIAFTKTCQRCGIEFACGGSCCWCDEIVLDADTRAVLRERFTDCLCRACLESARDGQLSSDRLMQAEQ